MKASVGVRTDPGQVRDGNEDAYLVHDPLFGIADGMGGHIAGDVASQTAVETILARAGDGQPGDARALAELVHDANEAIWSRAQDDPALQGMGTTCTLLLVVDDHIDIAHVGDSRAYLFRNDELTQITEDHTLVGRMVREGRLDARDAERHPQRNIITRALGIDRVVDVDTSTLDVQSGDRILICSDGLTSMLDLSEISDVLRGNHDPQQTADRLVELANAAGGEDNITVVVLALGDGSSEERAEPARDLTPVAVSPAERSGDPGPVGRQPRQGSWVRAVVATLVVLVAVLGAAFAVFRFVIVANSYYVGLASDGHLAIFQGFPDDVVGMTFHDEIEVSEISLGDLPEFLHEDVVNGIDASSLADARETLKNLEDRAKDTDFRKPGADDNKNRKKNGQ